MLCFATKSSPFEGPLSSIGKPPINRIERKFAWAAYDYYLRPARDARPSVGPAEELRQGIDLVVMSPRREGEQLAFEVLEPSRMGRQNALARASPIARSCA